MKLEGKIALVTGGGRGIGKAISTALANQGANVLLGGTNLEVAEQSAEEIRSQGGKASAVRIDVSSSDEIKAVFDKIAHDFKALNILVNNAGITKDGLMLRMKEEDWDQVLNVNLKGAFLCSQLAIKQMIKQREGSIVNISSIVGQTGNPGQANYTAAKAGLIGLTKTMAREVASRGVRVNAIAPGFIDTDMTKNLDEKIRQELISKIPLGRLGSSEDIASAVCFLVSGSSSYITGQVININGGMLM